jgi:hypothetical protein
MRPGPTPYEILGVAEDAGPDEIRRRYRELARQYHPDVSHDKRLAHEQFVRIAEAYRILSDPDTRAELDERLERSRRRRVPVTPVLGPLERARLRLSEGALDEALLLCSEALDRTPEDPEVHRLLAAVYRARGSAELAAKAAARAARLAGEAAPSPPAEAPGPAAPGPAAGDRARLIADERPPPTLLRRAVLALCWAALAVLAGGVWVVRSETRLLGLPWPLTATALAGPLLLGAALGGGGILGSFDDELTAGGVSAPHGVRLPVGIVLVICGALWAPLALLAAIAIGLLSDRFLRGATTLLAASLLWSGNALGACVVQGAEWWRVVVPGLGLANWGVVLALGGWGFTAMFRPRFWE